jgi:ABC-type multidrug transport system fused ATPase/permease subunit
MSVAKPTLEYVKTIRTQAGLSKSVDAFKRLLRYHKPYVYYYILIIALSLLRAYLFTLEPLFTAQIIDKVVIGKAFDLLPSLISGILLSVAAFAVVTFVITYLHGYVSQLIIRDLRSNYYASLQSKSFKFYDSTAVGDLVSRAVTDLQAVDQFLRTWVGTVANAIFSIIFVFIAMLSVNPVMSLIAMIPMPLIFYFTTQLWVKTMPLFRKMQLTLGRLGAYIQQNILGMKNVRIFQRESEMEDGFQQIEKIFVDTAVSAGKLQSIYMPSAPAILTLGITMVYLYGGNLIVSPTSMLTIGGLTLFARYMTRLTFPLRDLSTLSGTWINASAGIERIYEIMNMPVDVKDKLNAKDITIEKGEIEFRNVTFGYEINHPVLNNISFKAHPGEKIAILGSTGSGKTSLVYLIPRLYDINSGSILIDGNNIIDFKLSSLRRQIGIVLQDVFIFTGTLKDNIAFGKPDASLDDIIRVAKLARIHDFIAALPDGYNTIVGERGVTLSGGQRQRITIARALLISPKILILDDSLSFVDSRTEQEIQDAINEAVRGKACFIIAQRLSTIKNADKILVLDNGKIAEFGSHEELMANNYIYKRIYETQFVEKTPIDLGVT